MTALTAATACVINIPVKLWASLSLLLLFAACGTSKPGEACEPDAPAECTSDARAVVCVDRKWVEACDCVDDKPRCAVICIGSSTDCQ